MDQNLTTQWVGRNWNRIYGSVVGYLAKRLPDTVSSGDVEDHVMSSMTSIMEKDALRDYILDPEGGHSIEGIVALKVYQTTLNTFRAWGRDASLRETHGALSSREMQHLKREGELPPKYIPSNFFQETLVRAETSEQGPEWALYKGDARSAEDQACYESLVEHCAQVLEARFRNPRYVRVFRYMLAGLSLKEMQDVEGKKPHGFLLRIRECLSESVSRDLFI